MAEPERYFSIPADGSTITLGGGIAVADFRKGTLKDGDTTYQMKDRLKKGEHIYSIHIRESGGQIVYVWPEGGEKKIPIQASDERDLLLPPFTKLYIQRAAAGAIIDIVASTDISGYFFSGYGLKKKLDDIENYVDELESAHQVFGMFGTRAPPLGESLGDAYFVDGSLSESGAGTSWATGVLTIEEGEDLTSADQNDVVFVAPGDYDEDDATTGVTCDTAGIHIIGLGMHQCTVDNSNAGATAVFTITADHVEICGFTIDEATNTVEGVVITADDVAVMDMQLVGAMEVGIRITAGNRCLIKRNVISGTTSDGIRLAGASTLNRVVGNKVNDPGADGIELGVGSDENWLIDNDVHNAFAVGITVSGDNNIIRGGSSSDCPFAIADGGTDNFWDVPVDVVSSGSFNRAVADGVGQITEIDDLNLPASGRYTVKLDVDALDVAGEGGTITARLFGKTDDTNYTIEDLSTFDVPGADEVMPAVSSAFEGGAARLRVTFQTSIAVTANRIVYWKVIKD